MAMTDEELLALAKMATQGEWCMSEVLSGEGEHMIVGGSGSGFGLIAAFPLRENAMFVLEASPVSIIRLIRQQQEAEAEAERLVHQRDGYKYHLDTCEQLAGRALNYPRCADDQVNFPGATDADGVCTGDHVGDTIVAELATDHSRLKAEIEQLRAALKQIQRRAFSDGRRTFDDCMRDLGWIDDHARQALETQHD